MSPLRDGELAEDPGDAVFAVAGANDVDLRLHLRRRVAHRDAEAGESAVLAAIAAMPPHDRRMAERIHAIVKETAPQLMPKTWYGMPAYARDGKVVVFFKAASKFGMRYADLGFNEEANLDDGAMWPDAFALKDIGPAEEKRIAALVKKAVS